MKFPLMTRVEHHRIVRAINAEWQKEVDEIKAAHRQRHPEDYPTYDVLPPATAVRPTLSPSVSPSIFPVVKESNISGTH